MGKAIDLKGQRFNRLIVLERDYDKKDKSRQAWWKCKCDCGKEISVRGQCLRNGNTQSCGCYGFEKRCEGIKKSEKVIQHCREMSKKSKIDMIGFKSGKLTVVESTDISKHGSAVWKCRCDCGNFCYVTQNCLRKGDTKSCGCIKSFGEEKISSLLLKNNIIFEREKQFDTCIFLDTNKKARFDFWIDNKYIVEFDGKQHFTENNFFEQSLEDIQLHDKIKNNWCKENNISIIRIPYTHLEDICLEDLLLETSNFII